MDVNDDGIIVALGIALAGSGTGAWSERALALLRKRLVPETVDRVPGVEVGIGGLTAELKDFTDLLGRRAPLLFAFVLGLAFLLLMDAFRSTVVAAKAVRSVLVPAAMKLLGRWNWYPPR